MGRVLSVAGIRVVCVSLRSGSGCVYMRGGLCFASDVRFVALPETTGVRDVGGVKWSREENILCYHMSA